MTLTRLRIGLASVILVAFAGLHGHSAWQGYDAFSSTVFAISNLVAAYALLRRCFWARWFGLGIGVVGLLNYLAIEAVLPWTHGAILGQGVAFVALVLSLLGRDMARSFEAQAGWPLDSWRMRLISWAAVLNVGAVGMLIRWVSSDWSPTCIDTASVAGILLGTVGVILVWSKRTAGLLLLVLGAFNAVALATISGRMMLVLWSAPAEQGGHGACNWVVYEERLFQLVDSAMVTTALVPAAASAVIALLAFSGPIARFLRNR